MEVQRAIVAELGIQVDDREGGGILQGVGQVLASLADFPPRRRPARAHIFRQTLAQSDRTRHGDNNRHNKVLPTGTIRLGGCRQTVREEHAETDIEIGQHTRITRQGICQQNIAKLAILRLREASDSDPFQCQKEADAACPGGPVEGPDQDQEEDNKDRLRNVVETTDQLKLAVCDDPEDDQPEGEWDCEDGG